MLLDIFGSIIETIGNWVATLGFLWVVVIGFVLVLLTVIISFICTQFSIELKTLRAVNRLNKYLELNPFVTEDNLVEFNKLMKRIPSTMRRQWQQFMVSRDKKPSEFFSEQNCVDKPFKASAYTSHIAAVRASIISIALIGFVFCTSYYANGATNTQFSFLNIVTSLLLPSVTLFVGEIYILFLKARRNSTISDVYYNFDMLQKYLDRAVTTLPDYVDYEILFTRKEITAGIPVLQEYLQQRAMYEQEQIKKAKDSQVVHEQYDFSALGINGSLVMEKAMQVSEQFIGNKNGTRAVISELEGERDLLEKNYDEKAKAAQRKLRDIQETLDRLKEKLDATTNLIVGNDLRKQRENEIQKQRQIEKEAQEDNRKFEEERKKINAQIEAKRVEIEEDRKRAETSLNSEFKSYADKIYAELKAIVDEQNKEQIENLSAEANKLQLEIEERDRIIVEKNALYDENLEQLQSVTQKVEEQDQIIAEQEARLSEYGNVDDDRNREIFAAKQELESRKLEIVKKDEQIENQKNYISELKRKKHITGDEVYADADGRMYFIDEFGNKKFVNFGQSESGEQQEPYSNEQLNQAIEQSSEEFANQIKSEIQEESESNAYLGNIDGETQRAEEFTPNFNDTLKSSPKDAEPVETNLENLKSKFHKPVYDFKWENSNSLSAVGEDEEKLAEEQAQKGTQNKKEKKSKDELDELDKLIEEQNAELEKQNQNLSKQLEETQKVVIEQPKENKSKAKKPSSASKKASTKKVPKSKSVNKPTKKPSAKKSSSAKASTKSAKAEPKKNTTQKSKAEPKKIVAKKHVKKGQSKNAPKVKSVKPKKINDNTPIGELNLAQFNEQLKNMLKNIDDNKDGSNE